MIQRVKHASVEVNQVCLGKIGQGLLVLLGVGEGDTKETAEKMFQKMIKLRIFSDENGKTNLTLRDVKGELMVISQFTLYANCKKGNRPSFIEAAKPDLATELYEYFLALGKEYLGKVETGEFGADMEVSLLNDGPFTIVLDSKEL